ncbi:MAG: DUF2851 family protein [Rikenellaceae bacterium]|jgi:hypothetical protein|nr:DUF2851 family protein [Rikenellaceae bacterium]
MTTQEAILDLNRLLWGRGRMPTAGVEIVYPGGYDERGGYFTGAEFVLDGVRCRGTVFFSQPGYAGDCPPETVLHVVSAASPQLHTPHGAEVPQVVAMPGLADVDLYARVRTGGGAGGESPCAAWIRDLDEVKRLDLFTRLYDDRAQRKYAEVLALLDEGRQDWNYVLYMLFFRAMGGSDLKEQYASVARRVPYHAVAHEKGEPRRIEAMLLGASGLLDRREDDSYTVELKRDFDYLSRKYGISPMAYTAWRSDHLVNYAPPVLRLVQIAGFLVAREFIFDKIMACRTPKDLYSVFRAEISDYWLAQFQPSRSGVSPGALGRGKIELLGINLVVPLMYAYAVHTADDTLREAAIDQLDALEPESNRKTSAWRRQGVVMRSAHDSQAILELHNEYCVPGRCYRCRVGNQTLKNL